MESREGYVTKISEEREISDKQVGELWARHDAPAHEYTCGEMRAVILKLIEERADHKRLSRSEENPETRLKQACTDFSIPYADYLTAKEGK